MGRSTILRVVENLRKLGMLEGGEVKKEVKRIEENLGKDEGGKRVKRRWLKFEGERESDEVEMTRCDPTLGLHRELIASEGVEGCASFVAGRGAPVGVGS